MLLDYHEHFQRLGKTSHTLSSQLERKKRKNNSNYDTDIYVCMNTNFTASGCQEAYNNQDTLHSPMPTGNLNGSPHHNRRHTPRCSSGVHLPPRRPLLLRSIQGGSLLHPPASIPLYSDPCLQTMLSYHNRLTEMCFSSPHPLYPSPLSSSRFHL